MRRIVHLCLAAFYIDNYGYQENIFPQIHQNLGLNVEIIASTETYLENKILGNINAGIYVTNEGIKITRIPYKSFPSIHINKRLRLYSGLYSALENANPNILFIHDVQFFDLVVIRRFLNEHKEIVVYSDCHTDFVNSGKSFFSKYVLHYTLFPILNKLIESRVSVYYGTTPMRVNFLNQVYRIRKEKIKLLPFGHYADIQESNSCLKSKLNCLSIKKGSRIFVSGGKWDGRKNLTWLLDIFAAHKGSASLILFGALTEKTIHLQSLIDDLPNVHFIGWVESKNMINIYDFGDLMIFPGTHSVLWEDAVGFGMPCFFKHWIGINHYDHNGNCHYFNTKIELEELVTVYAKDNYKFNSLRERARAETKSQFNYNKIAKSAIDYENM